MARALSVCIAILAVSASGALVAAPQNDSAKPASRPIVVVFDTEVGLGADKALAASTTRAVCSYLRDTQRVEAVIFNRESPTVLRAIMEKQLTADQVASYSSQEQRIAVAKALAYDYAAGAEVSAKDGFVQVKLWVAKANGGKKDRWETASQAAIGTTGTNNYDNAMQSAASASVIAVSRSAFVALPVVTEHGQTTEADTTAINTDLAAPAGPSAADYAAKAEASLAAGDLAVAIQQYQLAVNADPTNATLRMLLVDAYARKKMYNEAHAELGRAELMGASAQQVAAKRKMIDGLQSGRGASRLDPHPAAPKPPAPPDAPASTGTEASADTATPKSAVAQMLLGDRLWKANKPDEAAEAYREAIKLNPNDWRAYERLALVDASISMFTESRMAIEQLAKVQPNPSDAVLQRRYSLFSTIFEQWFATLFKQYDQDSADFAKQVISRESYYSSIKALGLRLESMAKFVDALPVPEDKKNAALHRSLACGLLFQGVTSLQDYLESNSKESKLSAETFVAQAKKELEKAKALETNRVVVQQQPQPAPAQPADSQQGTAPAPEQPANESGYGEPAGQPHNPDEPESPPPPAAEEDMPGPYPQPQGPPGVGIHEGPVPPPGPPGVDIHPGPPPSEPLHP